MGKRNFKFTKGGFRYVGLLTLLVNPLLPSLSGAVDINNSTGLDVSITSVFQEANFFKDLSGSQGKGSTAVDIGINFHPTDEDEAQITLSFAAGNGLKQTFANKGFSLMPNADDLEDDLKNINGRNRDYLLEAWYKHTFTVRGWKIAPTVGIIDATAYIDTNDYANDETTQFMNDAFVNNPLAELPSYDLGGVLDISRKNLDFKVLVMNTKNDDGKDYDYYTAQVEYSGDNTSAVKGNYRLYYWRTSKDFTNYKGQKDYKEGVGFSGDRNLEGNVGLFSRLGFNTHTDTGDFKSFVSGGFTYSGWRVLNKPTELGVGLGYLSGNKKVSGIKSVKVGEVYYKLYVNGFASLTLDVQYQEQKNVVGSIGAWVYGVRLNATF